MPRVSVIIPNYNHAPFLRERIDSVLNQTFQDFELILLDDCSTDDSLSILKEYAAKDPRISLHPNTQNSGSPFAQWNKGVGMANADIIWIAESDDSCLPHFLEKVLPVLENNAEAGIAYCQSDLVDEEGRLINNYLENLEFIYHSEHWRSNFIQNGEWVCREWMLFHNPIPNASGCLIRKKAYQQAGGADPAMRLNGDWFLYTKILSQWKLGFVAETLNHFRVHQHTQRARTRTTYKVYDEIIEINRYIVQNIPGSEKNAAEALKRVAGWWAGSLPYQKWNRQSWKANLRLYRTFNTYKSRLILGIVYIFAFVSIRKVLKTLGLIKAAKKVRGTLFPGKYFNN
ncbi:MAG: glycosyltransferase [Owenweeksia sp.]|nr:glycosyltransferase [Owenweeksia sp.]MBF97955.1 glycosyltransferase [Owenweeksia sp.]HBF21617.1 glycosyltransferase family 2 protein [Cryomorphaceae bacterium]|tara:strand:- start:24191 stop:25219 length:1029 start_codon:yes stop_codon:yes gene_type:complete